MINRRSSLVLTAALAMLGIASAGLAANKLTIEPECSLVRFKLPTPIAKNDRFVAGQVVIPRGNVALSESVLVESRLTRLACINGNEACVYGFPPSCGEKPAEVAVKLTTNIFACRGTDEPTPDSPAPISIGKVFPHAIIRLPKLLGQKKLLKVSDTTADPYFEESQSTLKDLGAEQAWQPIEQDGWIDVTTAVIDSGIDLDHPDLAPQLEVGVQIPCVTEPCDGGDPELSHGTAMAGIIGSARYNGWMIGTAWNTRLLPIRITAGEEFSFDAAAAVAVRCAAHRGAKVVNFSIGGTYELPLLADALANTTGNLLFVASAGNGGDPDLSCNDRLESDSRYPASYAIDRMIVVMSHDGDGRREGISSWSPNVDIAAPGYAMFPVLCNTTEIKDCYRFEGNSTSNAAAYVSGAAALLWSVYGDWSFADIKWRITENAIEEPQLDQCMPKPRRLNLERMMFPVNFKIADSHRRIKSATLQSFDLKKKPLSAEVDLDSTFPPRLCKSVSVDLVRARTSPQESLNPANVKKGDTVQIFATCHRTHGLHYTARSVAYEIVD